MNYRTKDNHFKSVFAQASKDVVSMSVPLFMTSVLNTLKRFIGMIMIAYLGRDALAAGALITTTQTTLLVFIWSLMFSVGVVVARAYGARLFTQVGTIYRQSLLLGTVVGIPASVFMWYVPVILHLCGQPTSVVNLTDSYFHVLAFGVLPSMWVIASSQFLVGIARPKVATFWGTFNLPLTVLFGYVLIFGHLGFPRLGLVGFAYATTIIWWTSILSLIIYFAVSKKYKRFAMFDFSSFESFKHLKKLFQLGWPISIQNGAELLAWTINTIFIGWFGAQALGAQQIVVQLLMVSIMVGFVFGQASGILIGHALGRKDYRLTRAIGYVGLILGLVMFVFIALIYLMMPKELIRIYINIHDSHNALIIHLAIVLLAVQAFILFFDGARNIFTGALRGFHDTKVPMVVGIFVIWAIGLPLGYLMAFTWHLGPIGIYLAQLIGVIIGAIMMWRRFEFHVRRLNF